MGPSSSASGSSLAWTATTGTAGTTDTNHPGMTHPDLAHASSPYPSSSNRYEHESFSLFQKQRQSQSMRTREEQDNDMDIISALGIADQPYQSSYDFFSSASSPPRTSSLQQQQQYHHPNQYLTPHHHPALSAATAGAMPLNGARMGQEDYETHIRTVGTAVGSDELSRHGSMRRALSYELRGNERELQHLQEEGEGDLVDQGEEDECALKLEGEADSILDEDLEHLSPIPFSDLPSLTNIGLCSHGIVKLSSNIKLLASATCVQICCNELSRIPAEIGFLRNLTLLDLSKNSLTSLPDTIMYLTKLVDLKLSFNQLESIPIGIGGLTKLAALSLESNRLQSIPSQIGKIKGLVSLDLSSNPITVLPAEIGKLQFLRRLKLDRCPLVEEFVHSPLHSPPTLLELAARVIVRHDVPVPPMLLPHLTTYIKSARTCSFCDGPYFDSWVKRGKMIEKNETFIPLDHLAATKVCYCIPAATCGPNPHLKTTADEIYCISFWFQYGGFDCRIRSNINTFQH
ncbi:hypothetical protein BG011_007689 [Mortierella polycephala]|uniref:L domain-like protein n=1 Tax=Mortierella polycephala TaxID=41804 RepID=A0A9P6U7J3_9FUNG|nr:hypothetical protein BG011_007689 [Mortierella polycephala]